MPMKTRLSRSAVRSRISCARRTRVRSISEALINWAFSRVWLISARGCAAGRANVSAYHTLIHPICDNRGDEKTWLPGVGDNVARGGPDADSGRQHDPDGPRDKSVRQAGRQRERGGAVRFRQRGEAEQSPQGMGAADVGRGDGEDAAAAAGQDPGAGDREKLPDVREYVRHQRGRKSDRRGVKPAAEAVFRPRSSLVWGRLFEPAAGF